MKTQTFIVPEISSDDISKATAFQDNGLVPSTIKTRLRILSASYDCEGNPRSIKDIAHIAHCSQSTVYNVLRMYETSGIDVIFQYNRSVYQNLARLKVTGDEEATIIAIACSKPPAGRVRWTLEMIRDELCNRVHVKLSVSTIHRVLKENKIKPHLKEYWCIAQTDCFYIHNMEEVLKLYKKPYDPNFPVVCLDEKPYQLLNDVLTPLPVMEGSKMKVDYEYIREGVVAIFMMVEPLTGRVHASPREHRTITDWGYEIKYLCDVMYPDAEKIYVVMDNLNTHNPAYLYNVFLAPEASRLCDRLEVLYTPKHASWLNMAEIAINIMSTQCLDRRIPDMETLVSELAAWEADYNAKKKTINWQFSVKDARIKLARLYPEFIEEGKPLKWPKRPIRNRKGKPASEGERGEGGEGGSPAEPSAASTQTQTS